MIDSDGYSQCLAHFYPAIKLIIAWGISIAVKYDTESYWGFM